MPRSLTSTAAILGALALSTSLSNATDEAGSSVSDDLRCHVLAPLVAGDGLPEVEASKPTAEPGPEDLLRTVRSRLVDYELAEEARRSGFDATPEVAELLSRVRRRHLVESAEASFVSERTIGDDEIQTYFAAHPQRFSIDERIATRFLMLKLPPEASAEAVDATRRRLEDLRERIVAGERFTDLAREHSEAENARRGGAVQASPRGTLLEEYEAAAWELQPGEVSDIVELPGGLALILLDARFPARTLELDAARPRIEAELRDLERERRRSEALAEAERRWPLRRDDEAKTVTLGERTLTFEELGVGGRPPRFEERLQAAIDEQRLARWALESGVADTPETKARWSSVADRLLAGELLRASARRSELAAEPADEARLRAMYERRGASLAGPELREFEVAFVAAASGRLRPAHAEATRIATAWREGFPPPPETLERWGPLPRKLLGNRVSPAVAAAAFGLSEGEISPVLRMERYVPERARFEPEGFIVLRLVAKTSPHPPTYEEARPGLEDELLAGRIDDRVRRLRDERGAAIAVEAILAGCGITLPAGLR